MTVLVIGSGTMGRGIAQVVAASGTDARVYDVDPAIARAAIERIAASTSKRVDRGKMSPEDREATLSHLEAVDDLAAGAKDVSWVIEAVPESMELKCEVLRSAMQHVPGTARVGSNTFQSVDHGVGPAARRRGPRDRNALL